MVRVDVATPAPLGGWSPSMMHSGMSRRASAATVSASVLLHRAHHQRIHPACLEHPDVGRVQAGSSSEFITSSE